MNPIVFPNPSNDMVYIKNLPESQVSIRLFDGNGRRIGTYLNNKNKEMNLSIGNLKVGVYYLQIISDYASFTEKLIKL